MELWFWFAVASALAGGIASFVFKVAAVNNHNISVLSVYSSFISGAIVLVGVVLYGDFSHIWELATFVAFLVSATFLMTSILKVESLKLIDTAIFFPLYKVTGPMLAIVFGIAFFSESFTAIEWVGLILSLMVPVLLITRSENMRQKNLVRGIYLLLLTALIGAVSVAFMKYGTDITSDYWVYILALDIYMALSAIAYLWYKYGRHTWRQVKEESSISALWLALPLGIAQALGGITLIFAFGGGGPLGIVYTINSLYILIPIVLSIIIYNEHWNLRKVIAIGLSIAALALLK